MQHAGVAPTAVTYSCLLQACGVVQDVERALSLYQEACSAVCMAGNTYRLLRVCLELFMCLARCCTPPERCSSISSQHSTVSLSTHAYLLALVTPFWHVQGVLPSDECLNMLIRVCIEIGRAHV